MVGVIGKIKMARDWFGRICVALSWTRRRNFSTSCLVVNSSLFLDMGTKLSKLSLKGKGKGHF